LGLRTSWIAGPTLHRLGCDLEARFAQHLRGHRYTTKRFGTNIEVVASREVATLREARSIERALKAKKNPKLAIDYLQR
jgi:predicted GIY-YIG superfamily endonuclease